MDAAELIAEGERLVRPCLCLSENSDAGPYSAVWAGPGVLKPEPGPWKHWITIDCGWLAKQGLPLTGILSVYTNEEDCVTGVVLHDPSGRLPKKPKRNSMLDDKRKRAKILGWAGHTDTLEEIALHGRECSSYPPIDAVFKYGSSAVTKWLRSLGLPKSENWDPYFRARSDAQPYDEEYRERYPLFDLGLGTAAILGGWHHPFDDDWVKLCGEQLVLCTFWNSEPWVEVWHSKKGSFQVKQRIT